MPCLFNWRSLVYLTLCISETQTYRDITTADTIQAKLWENNIFCVYVCANDLTWKKKKIWMLFLTEPIKERCHRNESRATGRPWKPAETLLIAFNRWINLVHQWAKAALSTVPEQYTEHTVMAHKSFQFACSNWLPPQLHELRWGSLTAGTEAKMTSGHKGTVGSHGLWYFQWFSRWGHLLRERFFHCALSLLNPFLNGFVAATFLQLWWARQDTYEERYQRHFY